MHIRQSLCPSIFYFIHARRHITWDQAVCIPRKNPSADPFTDFTHAGASPSLAPSSPIRSFHRQGGGSGLRLSWTSAVCMRVTELVDRMDRVRIQNYGRRKKYSGRVRPRLYYTPARAMTLQDAIPAFHWRKKNCAAWLFTYSGQNN